MRRDTAATAALIGALCGIALPSHAGAQAAAIGVGVQTYRFDEPETAGLETFQLVTAPWSAAVAPGRGVTLSLDGAFARGVATGPGGERASLSGLTDTELGVQVALGDWLVLGGGATLATGKSTLSTSESLVAGFVAAALLPLPINTWGSGRSYGGTVAMATQVGAWGVGLAGGYRVAGAFDPLPGEALRYSPGDQLQMRVAVDRDVAGSSTLSLLFGYQLFADDRLVETNLFKSGSRIQTLVSLAFPIGLRASALVYGGVNHRARGTLLLDESALSGAGDSPSQQLFLAGTNLRVPLGRRAALLPSGEMRVFRAEDGASQGWVGSAATSLDLRVAGNSAGSRIVLSPSVGALVGNVIVEEGAEAGFFGWQAGLVLRVGSGR
jgi:hypothetical protein